MAYRFEDHPPPADPGELPWLDRPDALAAIEGRLAGGEIDEAEGRLLRHWVREGYLELEGVLAPGLADRINADVQEIYDAVKDRPVAEIKKEFENAYVRSEAVRQALCLPEILAKLDLVLGRRVIPHQTLNLPVSSQQAAHSDAILMTTDPPGCLVAVWFALEDITPDSGPFLLYPESHRLPYISAAEVGIPRGASEEESARVYDANYYDLIGSRIADSGLVSHTHLPRKGDALFWHSNLIHGAELTTRADATRRSLIAHYFADGVEHYSDLFQRACLSPDLRQ
jgi:hypothetical protein